MSKRTIYLAVFSVLIVGVGMGLFFLEKNALQPTASFSGAITVYTSQPEEDIYQLIEGFNAKNPGVKVNVFRSGTEEVISKLLAEKESDAIQADLLLVSDTVTFQSLKEQDLLLSYKSKEFEGIDRQFIDPDNMFTGTKIIATGIIYNTEKATMQPESFTDLLKNDAKGNIIMPSPLYSGAAAYNLSVFTRTDGLGWNFYDGLKKNGAIVDKGNGAIIKAVAGGQKAYGIVIDYMAVRAAKDGSPVEFIYPSEGVPVVTEPIGILKSTKNAELAKAFVDYVLSEDGQALAADMGYTPVKFGLSAPEGLKSIDELKVLSGDNELLLKTREADKDKFSSMFN